MALRVIGAGFGRTGTSSLQAALERLGFAPCDHMGEVFKHPARAALWEEAVAARARGAAFDWERLYAGYQATTDWPGAFFWRDLADAYPEAKVILSVRNPEGWYESMNRTIWAIRRDPDVGRRVAASLGVHGDLAWMPSLVDNIVFEGTFRGRFADKSAAMRVFEEHAAAVQATIPPERLLVFEAADGWEPLCRFLGAPMPAKPFPHVNDAASVEARLREGSAGAPPADDEFMRRMAAG